MKLLHLFRFWNTSILDLLIGFSLTFLWNVPLGWTQAQNENFDPIHFEFPEFSAQDHPPLSEINTFRVNNLYQKATKLNYQKAWNVSGKAFLELSTEPELDDPLGDVHSYLTDPVNWDLAPRIEQRFIFSSHIGLKQRENLIGDNSLVRLGLQSRMEKTPIIHFSSSGALDLSPRLPPALTDFTYSPYLTFESQPIPWMKFIGDIRAKFLHYDVHNGCRTTCSLEPKGAENDMVPTLKSNLILGPWVGTELYLHVGTGFQSFDEREPIGSTAAEQISRATTYEVGIHTRPEEGLDFSASFWIANLDTDFLFLNGAEETITNGSSRRHGMNLKTNINMLNWLTVSGGLTLSQANFQETNTAVPLSPEFTSSLSVNGQWGNGWSSRLHLGHVGHRPDSENQHITLPSFTTLNLINRFQFRSSPTIGSIEAFLGMLNLTNSTGEYTQFFFDSQLGADQNPLADLHYYPGHPRMGVAGLSWRF